MKRIYLTSLIALVINASVSSQFKEGFIINNSNDTIYGYINFEGSINNSDHCTFKLQPESDIQIFKPGEIKAFRFIGSKYFSTKEISVDNKPQTVFLEWLIKGRASILTYSQSVTGMRFFLLTEDDLLNELTNNLQEFGKDGLSYRRWKQEYINTLMFYFRDCPSLQSKIETVQFDSKSLINITKNYHEITCKTEDCIIFEDKSRKLNLSFGVTAGFLSSQLKLNNEIPEKVYRSNALGIGLAINAENLPLVSPKFSARMSIIYYNSLFRYDTTGLIFLHDDDKLFKTKSLKIPIQLTYKFLQKKLNPYISLGVSVNLRLSYKEYEHYLIAYVTDHWYIGYNNGMKLTQIGINSGAGLEYLISPNLRLNFGYDFEFSPRFFGTFVGDYTYNLNSFIHISTYYRFNK